MGFLGKLFGKAADVTYSTGVSVAQAIEEWIKEHPKEAAFFETNNIKPDVSVLKDEKYRAIRFDEGMPQGQSACMVFDGKFYYTVGEYNDAVEKAYSPGGKFYQGY